MPPLKSGYLTDQSGRRQALVVSIDDWRALLNDLEELRGLLDPFAAPKPPPTSGMRRDGFETPPKIERGGEVQDAQDAEESA
ncbi:MAG: hypothetical protein JXM75_07725 [Chromatiaceae bacterium]|nr:hypothetical protein [Chromatiaceae bacterium]